MTERAKINRPIKPEEVAVIRAALERACKEPLATGIADTIHHLHRIDQCDCGCDSVDFVPYDSVHMPYPVADGIGRTPAGGDVGVIVWGRDDAITGLEIYSLGAEDDDQKLPVPASIRPFEPNET